MKITVKDESTIYRATKFWFHGNKITSIYDWGSTADRVRSLLRAGLPTGIIAKRLNVAESLVVGIKEIEHFAPREY